MTKQQPTLYNIYKLQPTGEWKHSSYILGRSVAQIKKPHQEHNNKHTLITKCGA